MLRTTKKIRLVGGENKVRKLVISEIDVVLVKTMNYVGVVYYAVYLLLVLCFIYFGLLTFV